MARLDFTDDARADIRQILDYLSDRAGRGTALRYALEFEASFNRLTQFPKLGAARPDLGPNARFSIVDPFLIFYDYLSTENIVLVLRVLHGRRKITPDAMRR